MSKKTIREFLAVSLLIIGLVALAWYATQNAPPPPCPHHYDVTWNSGGYAPAKGYIKASEVNVLPSGVVQGRTIQCAWFSVSPGDFVIKVRGVGGK